MITLKEKEKKAYEKIKGEFGYVNTMQSPRLVKVVISIGIGSLKDKNKITLIADRLATITGQKVSPTAAKKSIASFKVREGDTVGYMVTLRGKRMYEFLDRLLNIALPRTKDFRGISMKSLDEIGNYTMAIKEHTIFPETANEEIKDVFSFAVTIVTSATNKKEAGAFLRELGFPFKKEE
jgi:large subunit ribosomal protein L5